MSSTRSSRRRRIGLVVVFLGLVGLLASTTTVREGQAVVVTRFGRPTRILVSPGLAWRLPPPVEQAVPVDLRLRTTASGLYSTQLGDGSIIVLEAFLVWRVPADEASIGVFLRALRNEPREAAAQLRSILGSALQTVSGGYEMDRLINTDPAELRLEEFERDLSVLVEEKVGDRYGIEILEVRLERLLVPERIVASTIQAMIEDRRVQAQRTRSDGVERAGQIMSQAHARSRRIVAEARAEASRIESDARREAAEIYARVHDRDAGLYRFLRGMATLETVLGGKSTLVLRSDAYPLRYLVEGPEGVEREDSAGRVPVVEPVSGGDSR